MTRNRNGRRWAFWHRHTITIPSGALLTRTRIVQTPWFGLYLHQHHQGDGDRDLHNHPWWFATCILRGGYDEEFAWDEFRARNRFTMPRAWNRGSIHAIRLEEYHRIRRIQPGTVSLLLVGKRRQKWGYAKPEGWVEAQTGQVV